MYNLISEWSEQAKTKRARPFGLKNAHLPWEARKVKTPLEHMSDEGYLAMCGESGSCIPLWVRYFTESFPLFGYDLQDYDELFVAKLDLLLQLREHERVTWSRPHRAAIDNIGVYPRPVQQPLPVWLAVGGTPQSVVRAATLGLPVALA